MNVEVGAVASDRPLRARVGEFNVFDTHVGIWEDTVDEKGLLAVLKSVLGHLLGRGWTIERDPRVARDYAAIAHLHFVGQKSDLRLYAQVCGLHAEIDIYQEINVENRRGGRYDLNKFARMPRRLRLSCVVEMGAILRKAREYGYTFGQHAPLDEARLLPSLLAHVTGDDRRLTALERFNRAWTPERFARDAAGWPTVAEFATCGYDRDRDGVPIRNGDVRHFRDRKGYLQRANVYTNMNARWQVVYGGEVTYVSSDELFACEHPERELRRLVPNQGARLRRELETASKASNFRRVREIAGVLERRAKQ